MTRSFFPYAAHSPSGLDRSCSAPRYWLARSADGTRVSHCWLCGCQTMGVAADPESAQRDYEAHRREREAA